MINFRSGEFRFNNHGYSRNDFSNCNCSIGIDDKFGSFCVDIKYDNGGSYFTCIPISKKEYRREHKTKCGVMSFAKGTAATIFDDWGSPYNFFSDSSEIIGSIVEECIKNEIPWLGE